MSSEVSNNIIFLFLFLKWFKDCFINLTVLWILEKNKKLSKIICSVFKNITVAPNNTLLNCKIHCWNCLLNIVIRFNFCIILLFRNYLWFVHVFTSIILILFLSVFSLIISISEFFTAKIDTSILAVITAKELSLTVMWNLKNINQYNFFLLF